MLMSINDIEILTYSLENKGQIKSITYQAGNINCRDTLTNSDSDFISSSANAETTFLYANFTLKQEIDYFKS